MNQSLFSVTVLIALFQPCLASAQPFPGLADTSGQTVKYRPYSETQRAKEDKLCFRAQGCPNCDTIVLLEFGLATTPNRADENFLANGEFGILKNVSKTYGVGGTVFYGGDDYGARFGFRARVRRYLNRQIALDVGPGIVLAGDKGYRTFPSFSGQVAVDLFGVIAPVYQLEMERASIGTHWNSYLGVRAESYAAPIAFLGIAAIAVASLSSAGL